MGQEEPGSIVLELPEPEAESLEFLMTRLVLGGGVG
jgi:hypothetical protein